MGRLLTATAVFLLFCVSSALAQTGEISGKVLDENGEGVPFANVAAEKEGDLITGTTTDFDGFFTIKPLTPGKYDLKVSYIGYATSLTQGVAVNSDKITELNVTMKPEETVLGVVDIIEYKVPLIDKENIATKNTISKDEIEAMPTKDINSIAATSAGVYQSDEGSRVNIKGARHTGTEYYIDGIRVRGSAKVPTSSIEQLTVITGGVPAKYGDAAGGIITITTRGPSRHFSGGLDVLTSQGMDQYGYNYVSANLTGPIIKLNKGEDNERTLLGFFLSGEYVRWQDRQPSIRGLYRAKPDVLADLQQHPLVPDPGSDAFILAAETIDSSDIEKIYTKENVVENNYSAAGKLDFAINDNITVVLGGHFDYVKFHDWVQRYSLLNPENNPLYKDMTWRVFGRFTQKFGQKKAEEGEKKSSFQNAYYSIQFDYTKRYRTVEDETHGFDPFGYGYIGEFNTYERPIYEFGLDDTSGKRGWKLVAYEDTLVTFKPGLVNATTSNFTDQYYLLAGAVQEDGIWTTPGNDIEIGRFQSLSQIEINNGMINGQRPRVPHGIWYNTGRQYNAYGVENDDEQYRLSVNASVDILRPGANSRNKHGLEFGIEFEQRVDRKYSFSPIDIWQLMRLSANSHIEDVDLGKPYLVTFGDTVFYADAGNIMFDENDTIIYPKKYNADQQTFFDKSLRALLGEEESSTRFINTDALDPKNLSLDLFSPTELLDWFKPQSSITYYGYDVYGNKLSGEPSFEDFWKAKDANDNFTRPIGSFRPIYASIYAQDKFYLKDVLFNIGLRVDRFDANQKVLKDKYTLYRSYTVGEARDRLSNESEIPASVRDDYVVYVDDFTKNKPTFVGFRNGDIWYDADGLEVEDPDIIAAQSVGTVATPFLVNKEDDIKSENFDPSQSFKDYEPQYTFMPRIAFSFNVTDEASFFAHYDILAQRPSGRTNATAVDWFYLSDNIGGFINNPNLKPERTIDYQIGFRQLVSQNSAVTITAFYREMKDWIQVVRVNGAYPNNYLTWGNEDFGTVKGFSVAFDMRKTRTSNLSLKANYTLQFADGTGSDDIAQQGIIQDGAPNLKVIAPLSFDSRHTLNLLMDYSFGEGRDYNGPKIKDKDIFANAGINITARARSGEPYTAQANATAEGLVGVAQRNIIQGSINGARLPWNFRLDLKIYKSFTFRPQSERPLSLQVYLQINNLLNTENVLKVYNYTGNADDDGYLVSAQGQQAASGLENPESFRDLYNAWTEVGFNNNNSDVFPSNYSLPRAIRIGAQFNF